MRDEPGRWGGPAFAAGLQGECPRAPGQAGRREVALRGVAVIIDPAAGAASRHLDTAAGPVGGGRERGASLCATAACTTPARCALTCVGSGSVGSLGPSLHRPNPLRFDRRRLRLGWAARPQSASSQSAAPRPAPARAWVCLATPTCIAPTCASTRAGPGPGWAARPQPAPPQPAREVASRRAAAPICLPAAVPLRPALPRATGGPVRRREVVPRRSRAMICAPTPAAGPPGAPIRRAMPPHAGEPRPAFRRPAPPQPPAHPAPPGAPAPLRCLMAP